MLKVWIITCLICGALVGGETWYILHQRQVIGEKNAALRTAANALKVASDAISERDNELRRNGARETNDANNMARLWSKQARMAFDAGLASRDCTVPLAPGLRDLRSLQATGSFKAASVPREPDR